MKALILLIVVIVIGFFVYNQLQKPQTEEELQVQSLIDDFENAKKSLHQAGRSAGLSGMDTTFQAQDAIVKVRDIKNKLLDLMNRLNEDKALDRAEELEKEINTFLRENG